MSATVKANFDGELKDYMSEGKSLIDQAGTPMTYRSAAQMVLFNPLKGEEDMPGNQKADNAAIAIKLATRGDIELTVEELNKIKERVRKGHMNGQVIAQMDALIDPLIT